MTPHSVLGSSYIFQPLPRRWLKPTGGCLIFLGCRGERNHPVQSKALEIARLRAGSLSNTPLLRSRNNPVSGANSKLPCPLTLLADGSPLLILPHLIYHFIAFCVGSDRPSTSTSTLNYPENSGCYRRAYKYAPLLNL